MNEIRHDWRRDEVLALFELPFNDLLFEAQTLHRRYFESNQVQLSTLLNIKTGACSEDCSYCSQSKRYDTGLDNEPLMSLESITDAARAAKAKGATRFCMGAAWRRPKPKDFARVLEMIGAIHELGMETCTTLGMLSREQAQQLKDAGLDYYNHNLDTSAEYYPQVVTTHTYGDRLETLGHIREAGLKTCCGGIVGMGEARADRAELLRTLANLPEHPHSVPVNQLVPIPGTPFAARDGLDRLELVRCIAVARILMPASYVRLSAGRQEMSDELQALCFLAGANSVFYGDKLLTTANQSSNHDLELFARLGMQTEVNPQMNTDEHR